MNNVVSLHATTTSRADERMQFCLARRAMNQALMVWLATRPDSTDVAAELETTITALQQLHSLGAA